MLDRDIPPTGRSPFALRGGMLLGLVVVAISVVGLILLESLRSRLGAMSPGTRQSWVAYEFMNHHIVALSLAWVGLCTVVPSLHLARRRKWRRFAGMLIVMGPILIVVLGFVLYAAALSNGLRAVTG